MKIFLALFALMLVVIPALAAAPQEGQRAPAFTLPAHDGTSVSLDSFKGKWLVLYFYPKDATPGCSVEAHNFQADLEKYTALNATVVGVSTDDVASHVKFREAQELTFTLLSDTDAYVSTLYDSSMTMGFATLSARNTFLIDPKGIVRRAYISVDPATHSAAVLADLAELQKK
ncbi:MAG: peroxiredoxin [Alphaproteobacteria bacterium]